MSSVNPEIMSKLGIGSGLDVRSIVDSLVEADTATQKADIEKLETETGEQISALGQVKQDLKTFRSVVQQIGNSDASSYQGIGELDVDSTVIANFTTTGSTDQEINSSLVVSTLASAHSLSSARYNATSTTVGNGTLTFSFGTWANSSTHNTNGRSSVTVTTTNTTTLSELRDLINSAMATATTAAGTNDNYATASVLYDGTGYRLVITADEGVSNALKVVSSEGDTAGLDNFAYDTSTKNLTQNAAGIDAAFTVEGISMTRKSNTISDLYAGYTLELRNTSSTAVKLRSSQNYQEVETLLQEYVDNYNGLINSIGKLALNVGSSEEQKGPLAGDSLIRKLQTDLRELTSMKLDGYSSSSYYMSTLGISTQRDGTITLKKSTLKDIFDKAPERINAIFSDKYSTSAADVTLKSIGSSTKTGVYSFTHNGSNGFIDGVQMSNSGTQFTSTSGNSSGMVLNRTGSSTAATVYYGKSFMTMTKELMDDWVEYNGDINTKVDRLNNNYTTLRDQKLRLESRIEKLTERYNRQYASMETLVASFQETGNYLDQMLKGKDD